MKQKEINEIVDGHLLLMDKLFHKIIIDFDPEDIHDFRVEIKKLRAFLRLLNAEDQPDRPIIPKPLKAFYGYAGIIRNIQLHRHHLFKYLSDNKMEQPEEYIRMLDAEENYWKKKAVAWQEENDLKKIENEITKRRPDEFEKSVLKKFTSDKLDELGQQLHDVSNDESMHHVRKILKDLIYTIEYTKEDADLPEAIAKKEDLKRLTDWLGDFMDKCIQIGFLAAEYINPLRNENEKIILNTFKEKLMNGKLSLQIKLSPHFNELTGQLWNKH